MIDAPRAEIRHVLKDRPPLLWGAGSWRAGRREREMIDHASIGPRDCVFDSEQATGVRWTTLLERAVGLVAQRARLPPPELVFAGICVYVVEGVGEKRESGGGITAFMRVGRCGLAAEAELQQSWNLGDRDIRVCIELELPLHGNEHPECPCMRVQEVLEVASERAHGRVAIARHSGSIFSSPGDARRSG